MKKFVMVLMLVMCIFCSCKNQDEETQNNEVQSKNSVSDTAEGENTAKPEEDTDVIYVGSINSTIYHTSDCRWVSHIYDENMIYFESISEATKMGYEPCKECGK